MNEDGAEEAVGAGVDEEVDEDRDEEDEGSRKGRGGGLRLGWRAEEAYEAMRIRMSRSLARPSIPAKRGVERPHTAHTMSREEVAEETRHTAQNVCMQNSARGSSITFMHSRHCTSSSFTPVDPFPLIQHTHTQSKF